MLDHLDDLAADFLAIYRKDIDPEADQWDGLTGPRFFSLAQRVAAYRGVMYWRVREQAEQQPGHRARRSGAQEVPLSDLADLVEIKEGVTPNG